MGSGKVSIQDRMKEAVNANNVLIGRLEEFRERPDMIFDAKDILGAIAKTIKVAAPLMKLTPYGWLSWAFTLGGAVLEGLSKRKEGG